MEDVLMTEDMWLALGFVYRDNRFKKGWQYKNKYRDYPAPYFYDDDVRQQPHILSTVFQRILDYEKLGHLAYEKEQWQDSIKELLGIEL